jgi:glycosyltransferase involved in cell wall biosynthesis
MSRWLDLADEVIAVDSRSTDGTIELIRERLRHPKLRIIERDRGLYESWNEGIAATNGDWIYISTAGDTIVRDHLLHLLETAEQMSADVVISPPCFVNETGDPCNDPGWPPGKIVESSGATHSFTLTDEAAQLLAFVYFPKAILGSSASNLYRGNHLRARPFPTGFKGAGDSVWILRHAGESRLCFTPKSGSAFCIHPKEDNHQDKQSLALSEKLEADKLKFLSSANLDRDLSRSLSSHNHLTNKARAMQQERRRLWRARPKTATILCMWVKTTVDYLRTRARLRASFRSIEKKALSRASFR